MNKIELFVYQAMLNYFCKSCNQDCTEKKKLQCIEDSLMLASLSRFEDIQIL